MAETLRYVGASVDTVYFEGKSHTDPILEDPAELGGRALYSLINRQLPP
jgi:hypothetical protein